MVSYDSYQFSYSHIFSLPEAILTMGSLFHHFLLFEFSSSDGSEEEEDEEEDKEEEEEEEKEEEEEEKEKEEEEEEEEEEERSEEQHTAEECNKRDSACGGTDKGESPQTKPPIEISTSPT